MYRFRHRDPQPEYPEVVHLKAMREQFVRVVLGAPLENEYHQPCHDDLRDLVGSALPVVRQGAEQHVKIAAVPS